MLRTRTIAACCFAVVALATAVQAFDYASYKPADLDEILGMPRPKAGVDVIPYRKHVFIATLESYAEEGCSLIGLFKFTMSMIPDVYPREFLGTLSKSKCMKIKSAKGSTITVGIQDNVADFLPKEVPLGTIIELYCVLVCVTTDGPGLLVNEFKTPRATCGEEKLVVAAKHGNPALVKAILDEGADPNHKDREGWTPLMPAAYRGNLEVVKILIERGADVRAKDNDGRTVLLVERFTIFLRPLQRRSRALDGRHIRVGAGFKPASTEKRMAVTM